MSVKGAKNIKIFSNFSLKAVENDAIYVDTVVKTPQNSSYYNSSVEAVFLNDTHKNKKHVEDFLRDNSLFKESGFEGVFDNSPVNSVYSHSYRRVFAGVSTDIDLNNRLNGINGHPLIPVLPKLDNIKTVKDKLDFINRVGVRELINSWDGKVISPHTLIDIVNDEGKSISSSVKNNITHLASNYTIKNFNEFQKYLIWVLLFNELATVEDDYKTLGESLEDESFVKSVENQFRSFKVNYNNYTAMVFAIFSKSSYPANINYAKTIKSRDKFLELTKNDLLKLHKFDFNSYGHSKNPDASKIDAKVTSSTVNIDKIAEEWINMIRGKDSKSKITRERYKGIIAYAEQRAKADIIKDYDVETGIDDDYLYSIVGQVNPARKIMEIDYNKENILIRIFNLFGEEYIRNHIKLSHLYMLESIIIQPSSFIIGSNGDWVERFILASLGNEKESDNTVKTKILTLIFDIYLNFDMVNVSLTVLKKDSTMFDMYQKGLPLKVILNTMNISHSDGNSNDNIPLKELHSLGY